MRRLLPLSILTVLSACGPAPDAPTPTRVTDPQSGWVVIETHLHQFTRGSHAAMGVVSTPVALRPLDQDQLQNFGVPPALVEGGCTLEITPRCSPACDGSASFCAETNVCKPYRPLTFVDGGEFRLTGSALAPSIRIWFDPAIATYRVDRGWDELLFSGGETLHVSGGSGRYAFSGSVQAPHPIDVTSPDLSTTVHVATGAPFSIRWKPLGQGSVAMRLHVSNKSGAASVICSSPDVGTLAVPVRMVDMLPAPPRDLRIEVERYDKRVFPTAVAGELAVVHAAQTVAGEGWD